MWRKIPYSLNRFYRCHHDTRYEKTRVLSLNSQKPNKRYKNTHCPFNLSVKIYKEMPSDEFPHIIYIEHAHNHPKKALQSLSFKPIAHFVLGVAVLILSTKSIVRKNLEGKTGTKCLTRLRGKSASTRKSMPIVNCRISYLTQRDQSPLSLSIIHSEAYFSVFEGLADYGSK